MQRIVIEVENPAADEVKMRVDKTVVGETNEYEALIGKVFGDACDHILEDLTQMAKEVGSNVTTTYTGSPESPPESPVDKPTE
jgi:hypothetical protein